MAAAKPKSPASTPVTAGDSASDSVQADQPEQASPAQAPEDAATVAVPEQAAPTKAPEASATEAVEETAVVPAVADVPVKDRALTEITGIGTVFAGKLEEAGFRTVGHIAALTSADLEKLGKDPDLKDRIEREGWIEQARALIGDD